jgi:hypothetical protein
MEGSGMKELRSPLERENLRLREENDELRETLRQYREREHIVTPLPPGLPDMTPQEEAVFRALLRGPGLVPRERLYLAVYGGNTERYGRIIDVHLTRLRQKLTPIGYRIATSRGRGWQLFSPGESAVKPRLMRRVGPTDASSFEART